MDIKNRMSESQQQSHSGKKKTKLISIKRKKVVNEGAKAQGTKLMLNQSQMLKGASGLAEGPETAVEEQQLEDEQVQPQQVYEYNGPQLRVSKTSISFKTDVVTAVNDSIQVSNVGSTAIKYEWVKVPQERHFQTSLHDEEERFFCHHRKNCIRPGQTMDFSFSFKSNVQGVFYEDWEIKTEPFCIYPIEKVKFTGMAVGEDQFTLKRQAFMAAQQQEIQRQRQAEQQDLQEHKTTTPPGEAEDLQDPEVQRRLFEEKNRDKNLYYTSLGLNWFKFLEGELRQELKISPQEPAWNLDVKVIHDMIDRLRFDEQRDFLEKLYQEFLEFCRLRPYVQSPFYDYFRKQMVALSEEVVDHQSQARQQAEIWDIDFVAPTDEMSTQEWAKVVEKKEAVKQEYLKKAKKKKWGPEEEKSALEQVTTKTQERLKESLMNRLEYLDQKEASYVEHTQLLKQQRKQDYRYYNSLQNVKHLTEVDIEERKCILKVHLKIKEGPENEAKKAYYEQQVVLLEEQLKRMEEARLKAAQEDGKKKRKKNTTLAQTQLEQQESLIQLDFSFLEEENLQTVMANVKYLLDNQAKLIIMLVSYDQPLGRPFARGSIKFLQEMLQARFENNHILFQEEGLLIEDFNEKIENDFYQDNSILLMENLFFREQETGYSYSSDHLLRKVSPEEQNRFWAEIASYGNLLVVEDRFNLFGNSASLTRLHCDQNILGLALAHDIRVLAHCMSLPRQHQMAIIGGPLSSFKLLALNQLLLQFQKVYVFGEMGVKLAIVQHNVGKVEGMELSPWEEEMIGEVLKGVPEEVLVLPSGVVVQTKEDTPPEEGSQDGQEHWKQAQVEFSNLPEEEEWRSWRAVNFLESDMEQVVLEVKKSDKVLWMEVLCLDLDHVQLDLGVSNELFAMKQVKLGAIKNDKSHFHNYSQDQVTTLMGGALQSLLNQFQFVPDEDEEDTAEQQEAQEEAGDPEDQEEEQLEKKEKKKKARDNMQYVSDFYSGDTLLASQLLSGLFCPGLQNIDRYDLIDDRDNDDQFSFLDEI